MPLTHKDRVKHAVSAGGTGTLTLGAASSGYQAFVAGDDAKLFPYVIEDGTAWETGYGTYTHSGTTFARTTRKDSSTGAALNVTTSAFVYVDWIAALGERALMLAAAGTDADTTMAANTRYDVDMSAWATADRNYTLPTTATVGDEIEVYVQLGDASHELIIKTGAGQTCAFAGSTIAAATEITRLFISGERMRFRYQATNIWECVLDARIPCQCMLEDAVATSIAHATEVKITLDNEVIDVGSIGDPTTNNRIDIRRTGNYIMSQRVMIASVAADTRLISEVYKNATSFIDVHLGAAVVAGSGGISGINLVPLVAGDYIELYGYWNVAGGSGSKNTDTAAGQRCMLSVSESI